MFQFVQKNKRLIQVALVLLIVPPFAFFGLESYTRSMSGADDVATVDGAGITQREFAEELRRQQERLRAAFGTGFDPSALDTPETRGARVRRVERGSVEAAAESRAQALLLLAQFLAELALRDGRAVHRGNVVPAAHRAGIGLHAEERERRHDQQHERDLD